MNKDYYINFLKLLKEAKEEGADNVWTDYISEKLNITHIKAIEVMKELEILGYISVLINGGWGGSNCQITLKGHNYLLYSQ